MGIITKIIVGIILAGLILFGFIFYPHTTIGIFKRLFTALWDSVKWIATRGIPYLIDIIKDIAVIIKKGG